MAHQLRRIIAANIKSPTSGLTTGRISELDPRGGVMAVGINGVGKTTFLRLLPLFYGAKPSQVLRGSGRDSMVRYTLPGATSAVCYEYEREGEGPEHVRCAVMHCRPDKDAPQFMLIDSPYQEWFFVDENKQFVSREEFKSRLEARGIEVTPVLDLNGYRAVILNERLTTKEGVMFKRFAPRFSLGPKPLYNLDQLASAMASESLSFRDLKSVILARVADSGEDEGPNDHESLNLKREDVTGWLEERDHVAKVFARKAEADELAKRIGTVKQLNLELSALHVAVKEALHQIAPARQALQLEEAAARERYSKGLEAITSAIEKGENARRAAKDSLKDVQEKLEPAQARQARFKKMGIEALVALAAKADEIQSRRTWVNTELEQLVAGNRTITERAQAAEQQVNSAHTAQMTGISAREMQLQKDLGDGIQDLYAAETLAKTELKTPPRLLEIPAAELAESQRLGAIKNQILKPTCTEETSKAHARVTAKARELQRTLDETNQTLRTLQEQAAGLKAKSDSDTQARESAVAEHERARDKLASIDTSLSPPAYSLLAFLRSTPGEHWHAGARLLNPEVLARKGMNPQLRTGVETHGVESAAGKDVALDDLSLKVSDIPVPEWVDMRELTESRVRQVALIQQIQSRIDTLTLQAKASATAHANKGNEVMEVQASASLCTTALATANADVEHLTLQVERERKECVELLTAQQAEVELILQDLGAEATALRAQHARAGAKIEEHYAGVRDQLKSKTEAELTVLQTEKEEAESSKKTRLEAIALTMAEELAGKGIDPAKIQAHRDELAGLDGDLRRIADNAHEVDSWKSFERTTLPQLSTWAEQVIAQKVEVERLSGKLSDLEADKSRIELSIRQELQAVAERMEALDRSEFDLNETLKLLVDFTSKVTAGFVPDWDASRLSHAVSLRRSTLATETVMLLDQTRALRNLMTSRSGQVQKWLLRRESELIDEQRVLEHVNACNKAQLLCDWFKPDEHGQLLRQLQSELLEFSKHSAAFVRTLNALDRRIDKFNRDLQNALDTEKFARFGKLGVQVTSDIGKLNFMATLLSMKEMADQASSQVFTNTVVEALLPSVEQAQLMRSFRDILQSDSGLRVVLADQVRLVCSVEENGTIRTMSNEQEFSAVSSNGNTALIMSMFLMGFVSMVRGPDSPVRLTWITDELARFDAANTAAFIKTLDAHNINVIGACPSYDPALASHFPRVSVFEPSGRIATTLTAVSEEN